MATTSDLDSLSSAISQAYSDEIPTFSPTAFIRARDLWRENLTRSATASDENLSSDNIKESRRQLTHARGVAAVARPILADVVQMRTASQRNIWERRYAPDILYAAEEHLALAVMGIERGDLHTAQENAEAARKRFGEAKLQALEKGAVRNLRNRVVNASGLVSSDRLEAATREIEEVEATLRQVRDGRSSTSSLRRRLGTVRARVQTLLDPGSGSGEADDQDPILDGDWAPGTFEAPDPPLQITITNRTESSIDLIWLNRAGVVDATILERQTSDGPWEAVAEFGGLLGWTDYSDTGLLPDTLYCYRVRVENAYGSSSTPRDRQANAYTRLVASSGRSLPVWRVQLMIRTANVPDAGTSDPVRVRLNSPVLGYYPSSNETWLDYGPRATGVGWEDDFRRGGGFVYDLNIGTEPRFDMDVGDITMISIEKEGTDALGIAEIELRINGDPVFSRVFGETASTCMWIDDGDGYSPIYTVFHAELRAHRAWQAYVSNRPDLLIAEIPTLFTKDEIVSRIEGLIGHFLHGKRAYWDQKLESGGPVRVSRVDATALRIHLDLNVSVPGFDPTLDIDLDIRWTITCHDDGTVDFSTRDENFSTHADFNLITEVLFGFFLPALGESFIARYVRILYRPIVADFTADLAGACPKLEVELNGDVTLRLAG